MAPARLQLIPTAGSLDLPAHSFLSGASSGVQVKTLSGWYETAPVIDLKLLHAKIGELTLEEDFLSGALSKAGLLSARRRSTVAMICLG